MTQRTSSLRRCLRAFRDDCTGNATIEFVILFPLLLVILFSMGEAGTMMARSVMLERGLDLAIRDLRLGLTPDVTHDDIKAQVCDGAFLIGDCEANLLLEVAPLTDPNSYAIGPANCIDTSGEIEPVIAFDPGTQNANGVIMYVRACIMVKPLFPGSGLGALLPQDASGAYAIVTQSAFINEPG